MLLILLDYYIVIIIMIHIMLPYLSWYDKKNLSILTTTVTTTLPAGY